jgi:hypothetical protein
VIAESLLVSALATAHPSRALWLNLQGKGEDAYLTLTTSRPLADFARTQPLWYPEQYGPDGRYLGPSSPTELRWQAVSNTPPIVRLGAIGGAAAYWIAYSAEDYVLLWDRGGGSFRPVLIVTADPSIILRVYTPELFTWEGHELIHVRVLYDGTGHLQRSVFLSVVDGDLTDLKEPDDNDRHVQAFFAEHGLQPFHRQLGFCQGSLLEESLATSAEGILRVTARYAVSGAFLRLDTLTLGSTMKDCNAFPK